MRWVGRVLILWVWSTVVLLGAMGKEEEYVRYRDPKQPVAARVRDLLGRMTVEEKIGQMVQIDRIAATPDIMKDYKIGNWFNHIHCALCVCVSIFESIGLCFLISWDVCVLVVVYAYSYDSCALCFF